MGAHRALMEKAKTPWEQTEVLSLFSRDSFIGYQRVPRKQ